MRILDFGLRIELVLLFAFGFGNLAMLGWLAAAAAPLLIHLWSRHRFRESPWAAMQFLLAAMRKNARRLQLQQWLLLAVRTLIILLVVLAVAEPYGVRLLAGGSAGPSHKVIVIDGSYSMAYRANGNTNFAAAKQLAAEMVSASHPGDAFTVILMASTPKLVVGSEVFDHAAVATQIESLVQPQAGADLAKTLALVHDAARRQGTTHHAATQGSLFLTDLQARTWAGLTKTVQAADAKKQIRHRGRGCIDRRAGFRGRGRFGSGQCLEPGGHKPFSICCSRDRRPRYWIECRCPQFRSGTSPEMPRRNAGRRRGGGRANG